MKPALVRVALGREHQTVVGLLGEPARHRVREDDRIHSAPRERRLLQVAVKKRDVARVDVAFLELHEIAARDDLRDVAMTGRGVKDLDRREARHLSRRSHVGPDDPASFERRIRFGLDLPSKRRTLRAIREINTRPSNVKLPAVIDTAQAAFFVASPKEMRLAMRTISM